MSPRPLTVVGLISGTSMDGIDVAAAGFELDGDVVVLRPLGAISVPYEEGLRRRLGAALPPAPVSAGEVCRLDNEVGRAFAAAALRAIGELAPEADLVASHGQTLYHWVEDGHVLGSLQIGQPAWVSELTGLPVVADLRVADIAAGGHGAPLAGLFDVLLLGGTDRTRVSLNLGGISNLTVIGPEMEAIAYDVGPANALIDAAVAHVTGGAESYDQDGAIGARGRVNQPLLERMLAEPYYRQLPPKTTGKELFHLPYLLEAAAAVGEVADDDLVATATALTAVTVADACRDHGADEVIAAGGGVHNPTLMRMLSDRLAGVALRPIDELGIPAAAKESYFIALIGFLTVHGLPGNLPSATGATRPVTLGALLPGRAGFVLPEAAAVGPTGLRIMGDIPV
jgi:anhydro-N-acetylmuramic acid kinase